MPELISDSQAIDTDWLTEALREAGVLTTGRVADAQSRLIGTGKMGDNLRITLDYEDAPAGAPVSVVAKLPAADPAARGNASGQGAYWREVSFYLEVAPRIQMRTPKVYLALIDESKSDFVILMEDLDPAIPGDQIEGCDAETAALALRELTKLQVPLVDDRKVLEREWIIQYTKEGAEVGQTFLQQMWPGFVERFTDYLSPESIALGDRFANSFVKWTLASGGPRTLVHGDYRLENMLFSEEEGERTIAIVDWQTCQNGSLLTDVAYCLGGGLQIEDRRAYERDLVDRYRGEIGKLGVELSESDCWRSYRHASLQGVLITVLGAMMSSPGERSDRMFGAMIERHLQHALDLEGDEFL